MIQGEIMAVAEFRLLYSALAAIYGEVTGKVDSERVYRTVVPLVLNAIDAGAKYNDKEIQDAVDALHKLAPYGIRRMQFKRDYLQSIDGLKRLPPNPDMLSPAYWW